SSTAPGTRSPHPDPDPPIPQGQEYPRPPARLRDGVRVNAVGPAPAVGDGRDPGLTRYGLPTGRPTAARLGGGSRMPSALARLDTPPPGGIAWLDVSAGTSDAWG